MEITLGVGEDDTLPLVGYNFLYKNGNGPIQVTLKNNNSSVIYETTLKVGQSLEDGRERFEKVTIKNLHDAAQDIDIEASSYRLSGTDNGAVVQVSSASDVRISQVNDSVEISNIKNPQKYFGHENMTVGSFTGSGVNTFVTPAANANGLIVFYGGVLAVSTNQFGNLVFDTSAPVSYSTGKPLVNYYGANNFYYVAHMPLFIPAGYGLYSYSTNSGVTVSTMYEVL